MELRIHGRGGQGGVTCAKLIATLAASQGAHVQAFGDYAGERTGAPIRAFVRIDSEPIQARHKVRSPDHVMVLDPTLLGWEALAGLKPGGLLLLNSPLAPLEVAQRFPGTRVAAVDATAIARRRLLGSRSLLIVNTPMLGAFARAFEYPLEALEAVLCRLGWERDLPAAIEAYHALSQIDAVPGDRPALLPPSRRPWSDYVTSPQGLPLPVRTGDWRTQEPVWRNKRPPCNAACPAGHNIQAALTFLARGQVSDAVALWRESTPLPAVCGRVCPAPCMQACNRQHLDEPVNIRALERLLADLDNNPVNKENISSSGLHLLVVGAGPAGLSAAFTLAGLGHGVTVVDREPLAGGVLATGIPAWRLPPAVLEAEVARIAARGVHFALGQPVDAPGFMDRLDGMAGVLLATGLTEPVTLSVPGAPSERLVEGLELLRAAHGLGSRFGEERVSTDGPDLRNPLSLKDKAVVVVGGGNTAIDCARTALRLGARVTLAYRRQRSELPAIPEEVSEALEEGMQLLEGVVPVDWSETHLERLELSRLQPESPSAGRASRLRDTGERLRVACDLLVLALGQKARLGFVPPDLEPDARGFLSVPGVAIPVYCCGDMVTGAGTVAHAIGHGRRMALRLHAHLRGLADPEGETGEAAHEAPIAFEALKPYAFEKRPMARDSILPVEARDLAQEVHRGLAGPTGELGAAELEMGTLEAGRCLSCGVCNQCETCLILCPEGSVREEAPAFGMAKEACKGCGLCAAECPRGVIELVPVRP